MTIILVFEFLKCDPKLFAYCFKTHAIKFTCLFKFSETNPPNSITNFLLIGP